MTVILPTYDDVIAASERLKPVVHRTPMLMSRTADTVAGARLFFKMENFQRGGAFKFRGAYNAISRIAGLGGGEGVVAYSSGNHAQAVALAAAMLGVEATIIMPSDAPAAKVAGTKSYGAEVILYDRARESREAIALQVTIERGARLIPPFDDPDVIAGQGTAAMELFAETGALDYLFVPVGGGGLISGCALAAAALSPDCRVIGVEPEAGDDVRQSLAKGERVAIPLPVTIADGAQTLQVGAVTFPIIRRLVKQIVTVDDDALRRQMHFFLERMKVVVEPTGCLAAAAAMALAEEDARIGVIVSGGNLDVEVAKSGGSTASLCVN